MIRSDSSDIPYNTLVDFVLGKLAPDDMLKVLSASERSRKVSQDLEFVIKILNFFIAHGEEMDSEHTIHEQRST